MAPTKIVQRWKNKTIYLEGKESDTVEDIKYQIDSLLSVQKVNQRLFKMDNGKPSQEELLDAKSLVNCGITGTATTAYRWVLFQAPHFQNNKPAYQKSFDKTCIIHKHNDYFYKPLLKGLLLQNLISYFSALSKYAWAQILEMDLKKLKSAPTPRHPICPACSFPTKQKSKRTKKTLANSILQLSIFCF